MKKIIGLVLGLVLLLVGAGSAVAAAVTWNTAGNDCRSLAVGNYTTNIGFTDPCWTLSSVNASPGQSINVRIYYHNTGTATATNTRIILNSPTINNATGTHSFTGQIVSDQGSISFGPVYVYLSSPQKLTFGAARLYPNQSQSYQEFGSEIITGGLNIGSIEPGWSTQGSVVASFYVNNPKPTGTLTPATNNCLITAGGSTCLINFTWATQNPTVVSEVTREDNTVVAIGNSGSKQFTIPFGSSTYSLKHDSYLLDSKTVTAVCPSNTTWNGSTCALPLKDCILSSFTSNKTDVGVGDPVILYWTSSYCKNVAISEVGSGLNANWNKIVNPTLTTTYTLTGYGDTAVTPTKTLTITVGGPAFVPGFPAGVPGFEANV